MGGTPAKTRRSAIVDAAREHFLARGYEGTKIGDIAATLGISKAAVSYYFRTKDTFLDELVEPLVSKLEAVVLHHTDSEWPNGVAQLLDAYLDVLLADAEIARWVDTDIAVQAEHHFGERLRAITDQVVNTISAGNGCVTERIGALAVLGGIWRPLLELDTENLRVHRREVLRAAMVSYREIA